MPQAQSRRTQIRQLCRRIVCEFNPEKIILSTGQGYAYHAAIGTTATTAVQGLCTWNCKKKPERKRPHFHHAGGELWHVYP
jgi:hypothetical protein